MKNNDRYTEIENLFESLGPQKIPDMIRKKNLR